MIDTSLRPGGGIATFVAQGEITYDEIINAIAKRYQLDHEARIIWDLRGATSRSWTANVLLSHDS